MHSGPDLNALVKQRSGLQKGTAEWAGVQNKINERMGDPTRHEEKKQGLSPAIGPKSLMDSRPSFATFRKTPKAVSGGSVTNFQQGQTDPQR